MSAERIAELTWQVYTGRFDDLRRIVEAQGGTWESTSDGTQIVRTAFGVTVGFGTGMDPVTCFVQVAFAIFGPMWPMVSVAAEAHELVNEQWRARAKSARPMSTAAPAQLSFFTEREEGARAKAAR